MGRIGHADAHGTSGPCSRQSTIIIAIAPTTYQRDHHITSLDHRHHHQCCQLIGLNNSMEPATDASTVFPSCPGDDDGPPPPSSNCTFQSFGPPDALATALEWGGRSDAPPPSNCDTLSSPAHGSDQQSPRSCATTMPSHADGEESLHSYESDGVELPARQLQTIEQTGSCIPFPALHVAYDRGPAKRQTAQEVHNTLTERRRLSVDLFFCFSTPVLRRLPSSRAPSSPPFPSASPAPPPPQPWGTSSSLCCPCRAEVCAKLVARTAGRTTASWGAATKRPGTKPNWWEFFSHWRTQRNCTRT